MGCKVSIISAIYNSEKYLHQCLDSLVQQTLPDIEIILINDASPDNSLEILTEYKNKYPNLITLIDLPENIGGGGALNKGLDIAQGEYISFVDPDDHVDCSMCEILYRCAIANKSDIVQFNALRYPEGSGLEVKFNKKSSIIYGITDDLLENGCMSQKVRSEVILRSVAIGPIWSRLYHRKLWYKLRYPADNLYFDFPIVFMPILLANKFSRVDKVLYYYKIRSGSVSTTKNKSKSLINHLDGCFFMLQESEKLKLFSMYKDSIILSMSNIISCRVFGDLFMCRHFYKYNSNIDQFLITIRRHIDKIKVLYPEYESVIDECCNTKHKYLFGLLVISPKLLQLWLDIKFGVKNLWHFVLG